MDFFIILLDSAEVDATGKKQTSTPSENDASIKFPRRKLFANSRPDEKEMNEQQRDHGDKLEAPLGVRLATPDLDSSRKMNSLESNVDSGKQSMIEGTGTQVASEVIAETPLALERTDAEI